MPVTLKKKKTLVKMAVNHLIAFTLVRSFAKMEAGDMVAIQKQLFS